jgi:hypothetical protein
MTEGARGGLQETGRLDLLIVVCYWPQAGLGLLADCRDVPAALTRMNS